MGNSEINSMENSGGITEEDKEYYEKLKDYVVEKSKVEKGLRYFTPHDCNHCYSVEKIVKILVEKSKVKLNSLEQFILLSAIWTHDLGMIYEIGREYSNTASIDEIREKHDEISAWYLKKYFLEIFGLQKETKTPEDRDKQSKVERCVNSINIISKYHRRKEDVNGCPKERFVENKEIRTRLLACLLRLGDTLHVDFSRFDKEFYDILQIGDYSRDARLHWLKSYIVSNVHLDDKKETIFINMDFPEYKTQHDLNERELEEGYVKLASIIKEDVYEDVLDVNETFREYNLTTYTAVKPIINFISGYDEKYSRDIFGIINDIEILLSPNDSKVNKKSLNSIISLCNADFDNYEVFRNQTIQLIKHLEKIYAERPCHLGLGEIINNMTDITNQEFSIDPDNGTLHDIRRIQQVINERITNIREQRQTWEKEVYDQCEEHLEGIKHIFVCGFSEMVSNFINEYSTRDKGKRFKDEVNIYVLEFGGKRRFLSSNLVEYNDGIFYSIHLKKMGFKNINLMPDTSLASCIKYHKRENIINSKNSLVLFGANGIYNDCGHSSGHLMVAIIAKEFKIPLKVIVNRSKEGEINWNLSKLRKGNWLTGEKDRLKELENYNINLINYLEDQIPRECFELITNK